MYQVNSKVVLNVMCFINVINRDRYNSWCHCHSYSYYSFPYCLSLSRISLILEITWAWLTQKLFVTTIQIIVESSNGTWCHETEPKSAKDQVMIRSWREGKLLLYWNEKDMEERNKIILLGWSYYSKLISLCATIKWSFSHTNKRCIKTKISTEKWENVQ